MDGWTDPRRATKTHSSTSEVQITNSSSSSNTNNNDDDHKEEGLDKIATARIQYKYNTNYGLLRMCHHDEAHSA